LALKNDAYPNFKTIGILYVREIYRRAGLERIDEIRKLVEDSDPLSIGSMLNYLMIMR